MCNFCNLKLESCRVRVHPQRIRQHSVCYTCRNSDWQQRRGIPMIVPWVEKLAFVPKWADQCPTCSILIVQAQVALYRILSRLSSLFFKKQRIFSFQQGAAWFRLHFCASRTTDLTFPRGFVETSCRSPNVSRKRLDFFHNSCYNKIVLLSAFVCPEMGKWQQKSTHSNRICFDFPIFRAIFPCRCSRT